MKEVEEEEEVEVEGKGRRGREGVREAKKKANPH